MSNYTRISGIYIILNTRNGNIYLGQATDFRDRWKNHKSLLNRGCHKNPHLQSAWNKYGSTAFKFKKLEYCGLDQLDEREQHYLDVYMPKGNCYNIASYVRASGRGRKLSETHRLKISQSLKGNTRSKGFIHTDETRQRMSESRRGENNPHFGKHPSDETLIKMSEAQKGNTNSKGKPRGIESKLKMSESHKGKKLTDEQRRKISESNKGRPSANKGKRLNESTRNKMRDAQKRRRERESVNTDDE